MSTDLSWAQQQITALERDFGERFEIWHVSTYIGADHWCARPWRAAHADSTAENISTDSPADLRRRLEVADLQASCPGWEIECVPHGYAAIHTGGTPRIFADSLGALAKRLGVQ